MRGLDYGLEAIRSTPETRLRRDIGRLARWRPLPDGAKQVAAGDPGMVAQLTDTMLACDKALIAPSRRSIDSALERDRSIRMNALANGGVEGLMHSLRPLASWSAGELCVPSHRDQELHLRARGLLLIPSYFCVSGPLTLFDPALPPVLIYPVDWHPDALPGHHRATPAALAALIGATRAAVLDAIGTRHVTTSELARRTGVSVASASEHAGVLRRARLVTSHRDGNRMVHHLTRLGFALLDDNRHGRSG